MDDSTTCPICKNNLRNIFLKNHYLFPIAKRAQYIERTCSSGLNHSIQFFLDSETKQVDFAKIGLNPQYSRFIEIDFLNQKCRIACYKENQPEYIIIPKMIEPDFPILASLKEKVEIYVTFS